MHAVDGHLTTDPVHHDDFDPPQERRLVIR